jgi:8-oxo-dGTP diphosphatase
LNAPLAVVAGIISNAEGEVLLAQRPPGKHLAGLWEFPGGKIEAGESAIQALRRELQEELNLDSQIHEPLGVFPFAYDWGAIELHVYLAEAISQPRQTEHVGAMRWIRPEMIQNSDLAPADVLPLARYLARSRS